MKYVTVVGKTYEDAIRKARKEYGNQLRVQSRRDVFNNGFLGLKSSRMCELTCYLTDVVRPAEPKQEVLPEQDELKEETKEEAQEVKEEVKDEQIEILKIKERDEYLLKHAKELLLLNDFTESYTEYLIDELRGILYEAIPAVPSMEELEIVLVDKIVGSVRIDHDSQKLLPHICAFVGFPSSGKTSTIGKIAGLYSSPASIEMRKTSAVVVVNASDSSYESIKKVGMALDIPVAEAKDSKDLEAQIAISSKKDVIFLDTFGTSYSSDSIDKELFKIFMELGDGNKPAFYLIVPASLKNSDVSALLKIFKPLGLKGFIATKLDETTTIGNIISICHDYSLPLVYTTEGKRIPRDLKKASPTNLVSMLKGFSVDIRKIVSID